MGKDVPPELRKYLNKQGKSATEYLNQICMVISVVVNAWAGEAPANKDLDKFITSLKQTEVLLSFPQILQNFRKLKKFEITKSGFKTVVEMTMICLTECNNNFNVTVPLELINMAGTYYKLISDGKKVYLLDGIKNHKIYQLKDFWEACLLWSISDSKENYDFHDVRYSIETVHVKNGFVDQIVNNFMTISMYMKEYSRSKETVMELMTEYIKKYRLPEKRLGRIWTFLMTAYESDGGRG